MSNDKIKQPRVVFEDDEFLADNDLRAIAEGIASLLRRLRNWAVSPKTVSFTPAKLVPAVAALILVLGIVPLLLREDPGRIAGPARELPLVPVVFSIQAPQDARVSVIGSFNEWDPEGYKLAYDESRGVWNIEVRLPSGRHEYSYIIDGEVVPDPKAPFFQDDGFGNLNSVILVNDAAI